jgi:hypothetical protein
MCLAGNADSVRRRIRGQNGKMKKQPDEKMNRNLQIARNSTRNGHGVHFAAGLHMAIGLLLMWIGPLASLLSEQAGRLIGLRETDPLLPCIGLCWLLIATAVTSRRRFVIKGVMALHVAALLLPIAGFAVGVILLLPSEPRGHMALSPAPAGLLLIIYSAVIAAFEGVCLFSLWRLLKNSGPASPVWTNRAFTQVAAALALFILRMFL